LPYFGLGLLQFEQGELAGAIATFQKAAELDPTDKILPNNLGFLCLITDRIDEAETYLLRARELTPDYYMPAFNLAAVRALRSDLDSARSLLAESLQLCPKSDDQEQLHWSIISILLGNVEAGFEQLTTTLATLTNPTEMCVIRGGVLEASQAIARSPLQTPDLHRAIDLLQSHLTPQSTDP
jgi:tetratricopeptide (TPR) repeat protein